MVAAAAELGSGTVGVFAASVELQSGSSAAAVLAHWQMKMNSAVPGSQSVVAASAEAGSPSVEPA